MSDLINPYYYGVRLRNWLYDRKVLKVCKLCVPVVSVGNLSLGGSGKSSLVRHIANLLPELHVCLLSRGYRRSSKGTLLVSSRGHVLRGWQEAGDEPYMLAKVLRHASVVVDEDRCRGAQFALKSLKPDLFILDDGFQHRRMARDLDILLLRKRDFSDRLLPFGRLREPLSSLERADLLVLSYGELESFDWQHPSKPTLKMVREGWKVIRTSDLRELDNFRELEFTAFAGLGDNRQFFLTLERLGIKTVRRLSFPDHYHYRDFILRKDQLYITTMKDAVKLPPTDNLYYLDFDLRVEGLKEFLRF
ncbi:MAG: tetraacyldisaccharide 4'-kinase [Aquificaceae bacterium]|nr:tetraacyldisaccharide 4'-kinase [Aquificaceae bacterium]MDW8097068.1 tetraacyldisaccharide 4'-kinase [Aquificaceae bacterium]